MVIDSKPCDLCGLYHDELVMVSILLVSGQVIHKYLCEECLLQVKKINQQSKLSIMEE